MTSFAIAWGLWVVGWQAGLRACHAEDVEPPPPSLYLYHHLLAINSPSPPLSSFEWTGLEGAQGLSGGKQVCGPVMRQTSNPSPIAIISPISATSTSTAASHCWFPQCCSVTFRQRQLSQSKGEMKKVRKRFPSFNLQISHSHHDFFCTFRKLFIFDAHVKLLQNQPPPD